MTIFDSGFRVAKLLRHNWFRQHLTEAGWLNGEHCMGVTPDTQIVDIFETMKHLEKGTAVTVVMARWNEITDQPSVTQPVRVVRLVKTW